MIYPILKIVILIFSMIMTLCWFWKKNKFHFIKNLKFLLINLNGLILCNTIVDKLQDKKACFKESNFYWLKCECTYNWIMHYMMERKYLKLDWCLEVLQKNVKFDIFFNN